MNDKELLELAAKAAGFNYNPQFSTDTELFGTWEDSPDMGVSFYWRPIDDDGDALRLTVKLYITIDIEDGFTDAVSVVKAHRVPHNGDSYEATRRAIVLAAAEIGRN